MYIYISRAICIYHCLQLYYTKYEFILIFSTLICYYTDYSSPFSLLVCNLSGFYYPSSIYSIVQFQHTYRMVLKLLICTPVGSNFISQSAMLIYTFLCFFKVLQTPLISKVAQASNFSPHTFSEVCNTHLLCCYTFVIQLHPFVTLHIPSRDPLTPQMIFFQLVYIKVHSLYCTLRWILTFV